MNMNNWEQRIYDLQNRITRRNWKIKLIEQQKVWSIENENFLARLEMYNEKDNITIKKLEDIGL